MSTVQDIIDAAQVRIDDAVTQANNFVDNLSSIAQTTNWTMPTLIQSVTNISVKDVVAGKVAIDNIAAQNATAGSVDNPTDITSSTISTSDISDFTLSTADMSNVAAIRKSSPISSVPNVVSSEIDVNNVADFSATPQALEFPELPKFLEITPPTGVVELDTVDVTLSSAPDVFKNAEISDLTISDPDSIVVDKYLIPNPTADYLVPSNNFSFVEASYQSEFKDSLLDALLKEMTVGATGINPEDELLLFQRGRDREAATYKDSTQQIARQMAARGFKIPPSAMVGLLNKAQDTMNKAMSGINRDIMLKRADLYVQAQQFAIQQGVQLETAMLSYHGAMMERALNSAKFIADFGIQYHNLQVQKFKDQLELWKVVSDVRTQWVDNAIKATETYKLKLEKMKLVGEQNQQRIQLQDAMNRATELANTIRKTELEIGHFKLENNKLKIEQSKLLTENYAESMRGNMIAFQAYSEAVKAQSMRNEPVKLAIELHREQRETATAEFAMKTQREELKLKTLNANLQRSEQLLQKYYKDLETEMSIASETSKRLGIELEAWKEQVNIEKINNHLKIEVDKFNNQNQIESKKITEQFKLEASKLNAELSTDVSKVNAQLNVEKSKLDAQMAFEASKINAELGVEAQNKSTMLFIEAVKANNQSVQETDRSRISDDRVAVDAAQVGAEVMMSIITGAQSSLGTIATLAEAGA